MATFVLALLTIAMSLVGLGIGVLIGRPPLAGGCGRQPCGGCERAGRDGCTPRHEATR